MQRMFHRIMHADMAPLKAQLQLSQECQHLITRLLDPNPSTRITVAEALCHPWVIEELPASLQVRICQLSCTAGAQSQARRVVDAW